jgi:hypothetical protein
MAARKIAILSILALLLSAVGAPAWSQTAPGARPNKVLLKVGGKAVRVTLSGKSIGDYKAARVRLGNRNIRSITARLGRARGGKRSLTLKAAPGTRPGDRYLVQLLPTKSGRPVRLRLRLAVRQLVAVFKAKTLQIGTLRMTGARHKAKTLSLGTLRMTGVRHKAKTISLGTLNMTGVRHKPKTISLGTLRMRGVRN